MKTLVDLLSDSNEELKCLAAETIANCAKNCKKIIINYFYIYK